MMKFKDVSRLRLAFELKVAGADLQGIAFLRWAATFLAVAYFGYVLFFNVVTGVADAEQSAPFQSAEPANPEATNAPPPPDLLQIADWHLFGQSPSNDGADTAVSETQLQLKLLGVFLLSQDPENAYAILQTEDGQQKRYRPGDELPGGATLQAIEQMRVVLLHGNRQESLTLKRNSVGSPAITENPPL